MHTVEDEVQALKLLERATALLEDVPCKSDPTFWHDYLLFTGNHMICTEEGWEPGDAKGIYEQMAKENGVPLSDFIIDEVNAPA